jgi:hypothetical protein
VSTREIVNERNPKTAHTAYFARSSVVLTVSAIIGSFLDGWGTGKMAVLYGAAMATPVGMSTTFRATVAERSYIMVFWAREKIRGQFREAEANAEARGEARGKAKQDKEWRAWYGRMQGAER